MPPHMDLVQKKQELLSVERQIDRAQSDVQLWVYGPDGYESIDADKVLSAAEQLRALCSQRKNLRAQIARAEAELCG